MASTPARLPQTLLRHIVSQKKQEFGEEAGHLLFLQKPMNIYHQIKHFCQVSAGYNMPVH